VANRLKMALIDTILTLRGQGWSQRRIARELQIDRETVARHLEASEAPKPATPDEALSGSKPATPGEALGPHEAPKPATPMRGDGALSEALGGEALGGEAVSVAGPGSTASDQDSSTPATKTAASTVEDRSEASPSGSQCAPFREIILAKLEQGLSAQRIWQDLVGEHGFPHRYHSVRRYVAQMTAHTPLPFRRMESAVGEEVQVDFGQGAWVEADGKRRRPHVFRLVLSHSRKGYSEVVWRQTSDDFLRCLENAFWHFGGVPRRIVLDNFKAAVLQPDWFDPELHPKLVAFAAHYGCVFLPTKPRTPRHKGKIERGIAYVQENALKGRTFASLNEQNTYLGRWEEEVADARVHGTTRRVVGEHFREIEQRVLLPLPMARFANFREARRTVHSDGHIEVDKAYYSAPPEYLGHEVWVRWDGRLVRLFNHRLEQITVHVQKQPGQFSTSERHLAKEKVNAVERGAAYLLGKVRRLGTPCAQWAETMLQGRGIEGLRVLQGLLHLASKHPREALGRACAAAHGHGEYRLRTLRALLKRQEVRQPLLDFMHEHPLIRPMSDYGQFVRAALHRENQQ
jgi:transposase